MNAGSDSRMRVGPASLTFVHPYPEIRESNMTSLCFAPSNQKVDMSQVRSIENRVQACALNLPQPPFPTTNTSIPLPHHSKSTFKNKVEGQEDEVRELGAIILINEVRVPSP